MTQKQFPKRQVHLDFHTSPFMNGVGSAFDEDAFAAELKKGHVNSITVFAKCHHGYCYYPTKIGTPHPTLVGDLTDNMVRAAHKAGARAPIYITAGWSELDANEHPEWVMCDIKGNPLSRNYKPNASPDAPRPEGAWQHLCLNDGSYAKHIYALTEEICRKYRTVDGLFYDIVFITNACYCAECRAGMIAEGKNPASEEDAKAYYIEKHIAFMKKCGDILKKYHPEATIFFNSGGADPYRPEYHPYSTHYELEDLPTVWGGYDKLPIRSKFFTSLGKPSLGMTGKFHLCWGEFGGFKTKEALRYEIITMAMNGVGCSIGDQMLPEGKLDPQTYENIGYAYDYLEKNEPFLYGESTEKLGLFFSERESENQGIACMLAEKQIGFDLVGENLEGFDTLILPESACLSDAQKSALKAYLKHNGKLLVFAGALQRYPDVAEQIGLFCTGNALHDIDYIEVKAEGEDLPKTPFLAYRPAKQIEGDGEVLALTVEPAFSRTVSHFCGHKNTPYQANTIRRPAVLRRGNVILMAHDIPSTYQEYGCVAHKRFFLSMLERLFTPTVSIGLQSCGRAVLTKQSDKSRYCLHVTYVCPIRRGKAEIIEDAPTLCDIPVAVKISGVKSVRLPLKDENLAFKEENGECRFTLPALTLHEAIVLEV